MRVNEETLRRWERGGSRPSEERLARLIAILAIDGGELPFSDDPDAELPLLARLLRQERAERSITQHTAAEVIGVAQPTYAGWEIGRSHPDDHHQAAVAAFIGVAADEVVAMGREIFAIDTSAWPPLGQLIGGARQRLRLTRSELAASVGVSASTIANWELGYRVPRAQQLPVLATALQVEVESLARALTDVSRTEATLDSFIALRQRVLGLTRGEIARRIGIDHATFSRWIHGHRTPEEWALRRLAVVLEVPRSQLPRP